jgi:hypothetical protein
MGDGDLDESVSEDGLMEKPVEARESATTLTNNEEMCEGKERWLNVVLWNVRSVHKPENLIALKRFLATVQPDVVVLTETWARKKLVLESQGYHVKQTQQGDY